MHSGWIIIPQDSSNLQRRITVQGIRLSSVSVNLQDTKYVSLMSTIRNKDQWTAKKFEKYIFDKVIKDIMRENGIKRVESWHDKATYFNSKPFLTFLLDDFHKMCQETNPEYWDV